VVSFRDLYALIPTIASGVATSRTARKVISDRDSPVSASVGRLVATGSPYAKSAYWMSFMAFVSSTQYVG